MEFLETLKALGVSEEVVTLVSEAPYPKSKDEKQDYANRIAAVLSECKKHIDPEILSEAMQARACCKSGFRLKNSRAIAKTGAPLEERLTMLSEAKYMGKAHITEAGTLYLEGVGRPGGEKYDCPCWRLSGRTPIDGSMPAEYCMCCAGHFRFHYEKALGRKLRLLRVVSSILESGGKKPCVFEYAFLAPAKAVRKKKAAPAQSDC